MEIVKNVQAKHVELKVIGRLDTATAPELEMVVEGILPETDTLVYDFEELEYVSSAGLRVLLKTQKAMMQKGGMKLIHVQENIMDILEVTGFVDILTVE